MRDIEIQMSLSSDWNFLHIYKEQPHHLWHNEKQIKMQTFNLNDPCLNIKQAQCLNYNTVFYADQLANGYPR